MEDSSAPDASNESQSRGATRHLFRWLGRHCAAIVSCSLGLGLLLFMAYGYMYMIGWKFSFTNFTYNRLPFSSLSVSSQGPWLSDVADNILPSMYATYHSLNITSWASFMGIGSAQGMDVYLFPLNWLYLLPLDIAQPIVSMSKIVIAFVSMFFFVRQLGYSWRGSFIAAASYSLCSTMVMWNGWQHSSVTMLAPLLFLVLDKLLTKMTVRRYIALSMVIYLMLVAGMPTYAAYFLYLAGAYMLFYGLRTYIHKPRKCVAYMGWFVVAVVFGAILSLPYTLQLLNSLQSSGYTDTRKSFASAVLGIQQIKTLLFPYLSTSYAVHPNEGTIFVGVLAVVSLPLAVVNIRRKPRSLFFLISAFILLLLIFTHVGDAFYSLLPAINSSLKFRVIVLLNFCLSVLVGINLDDLLIHRPSGRREILSVIGASSIGVAGYLFVLRRVLPLVRAASSDVNTHIRIGFAVVVVFAVVVLTRFVTDGTWLMQLCTVSLFCVVALDMGYFGYQYWPAISSRASSIPKATSSVTYLQQGTRNGEKIVNIGSWDFFPMTNVFYGIQNVNGHGFLYTQTDVSTYYQAIGSGIFNESPTRPVLSSIDQGSENLLQYMGVKYVVGQSAAIAVPDTSTTDKKPYGEFVDGSVYEQSFTSQNNGLKAISLHVKPSGQGTSQGTVTMTLRDSSTNAVVASSTQSLAPVTKESSLTFGFTGIADSSGKTYTMSLTSDAPAGSGVDFYMTTNDAYTGTLGGSLAKASGDMAITCVYDGVTSRRDGLAVRRLSDYAAKVQLTDDVKVAATDKAVLSGMQKNFEKTAVYFSLESGAPTDASTSSQSKLTSEEKISKVVEKADGSMSFTVSAKQRRFVVVNQYNDGNWVAYVDGKRVTVYKGNYLFRAIEVSSGTHIVKLRYVNSSVNRTLVVSAATGAVMLMVFVSAPGYDDWRRSKRRFLQRPPRHMKAR